MACASSSLFVVYAALQWLFLFTAWWMQGVVLGVLLKPLLSWRMLCDEVLAVEAALQQSLAAGRERLSWLVSRDTAQLDAGVVRESAIETLAENLSDSVIAPLFWFALLGLPGRRSIASPTRPMPCGATPAGAGRVRSAATGNGLANGWPARTMC